jgi:steroid delta-isomerase-like uncharacterized protein
MSESNEEINRGQIEEIWNQGNLDAIPKFYAADVVIHGAPSELPPGTEGVRVSIGGFRAAFPDLHLTIEDTIVQGDKLVFRWSWTGTHKGEFLGIPPSGKKVASNGMSIVRLAGGKIVEAWNASDDLGLMQQLGAVPS